MIRGLQLILISSIILTFSIDSNAAKFVAKASGDWSDQNTWDQNSIPTSSDTVYIDGYNVAISSATQIKAIFITNQSGVSHSKLNLSKSLTVDGNILVTSENKAFDVELILSGNLDLTVNGNVTFIRTSDNDVGNRLQFQVGGSAEVYILGHLTFDYKNSKSSGALSSRENELEIKTLGSAIIDVTGQTTLITRDGKSLDVSLQSNSQIILRDSLSLLTYGGESTVITSTTNSHFQLLANAYLLNAGGSIYSMLKTGDTGGNITVTRNVYMESTVSDKAVKLEANGLAAQMNINGDIIMNAVSDGSVIVNLSNEGELRLGGNIQRPTNYGALEMNTDGKLILNGTSPQTFPEGKLVNSGNDSLYFGTISIENTSSSPFELTSDLVIQDTLVLSSGNIKTSSSSLLVLENDASIKGGDANSFIEGPVLKKGAKVGVPFTFPLGDNNNFAPITITPVNNKVNAEYTAQYYSDPPPFGVIHSSIDNKSSNEYWELNKSTGTPDADITLSWYDAAAQGINDLDDLVVAGLTAGDGWKSYGNGGTTGTIGTNGSGTITNSLASDPPPFGVIYFTYGSTTAMNSLPVELTSFQAIQQNSYAYLHWETASERNTSHFSIEKSINGIDFKEIGRTQGSGDGVIAQQYSFKDITPENGINYYRLKIVDHDNTFEYSNIEVVNFEATPAIQLFPNPVEKTIQLEGFDSDLEDVLLEIFDKSGRLIFSNKVSIDDGRLNISTDLANVKEPGTYFLRVISLRQSQVLKFIKF